MARLKELRERGCAHLPWVEGVCTGANIPHVGPRRNCQQRGLPEEQALQIVSMNACKSD
jgi:hypothetical protein